MLCVRIIGCLRVTPLSVGQPCITLRSYGSVSSFDTPGCSTKYDVLVVGAGHAGCEAAAASARMGARTLLLTHKLDTIGQMSCNPSLGGVGKGHLVREVDALDGLCGRIGDLSAINYRLLNRSKGPAVWGPRAQIDRKMYKNHMQSELLQHTPGLDVQEGAVQDLILTGTHSGGRPKVIGVMLEDGRTMHAKTVVITTGTFLGAKIFYGNQSWQAGRMGDPASHGLSKTLARLGFRLGQLRTGTPPRLHANTVTTEGLVRLDTDQEPVLLSTMSDSPAISRENQLPTFITFTNPNVHQLVRSHLHDNQHVAAEVNGPRYCPSLEAKVSRFAGVDKHQVFLEPEGLDSQLIYVQGLSMTFNEQVQKEVVNLIPGLEKAEVAQPGYGVQYDYIDATQLTVTLETKPAANLFLAGQINGTTGYEEAAAQGLIAGINAAKKALDQPALQVNRADSYIGVLIDDLTSLGTNEPYRMFTSRAEFRLFLRIDNADERLTPIGRQIGCIGEPRWQRYTKMADKMEQLHAILTDHCMPYSQWSCPSLDKSIKAASQQRTQSRSALDLLGVFNVPFSELVVQYPDRYKQFEHDHDVHNRLTIARMYEPHMETMRDQMNLMQQQAGMQLPDCLDFTECVSLSTECREKLLRAQPQTLGAAARIAGVTPADLTALMHFVMQHHLQSATS